MLTIAVALSAWVQLAVLPPYTRTATAEPGEVLDQIVCGKTLVVSARGSISAYSLPSLSSKWSVPVKGHIFDLSLATDGATVFAKRNSPDDKDADLIAINVSSGKRVWSVPKTGFGPALGISGNRLFVSLKEGSVSAIDKSTRKSLWTRKVAPKRDNGTGLGWSPDAIVVAGNRAIVSGDGLVLGLNVATGAVVWQRNAAGAALEHGSGVVAIRETQDRFTILDAATGKELWHKDGGFDSAVLGESLVVQSNNRIEAFGLRSGKAIWTMPIERLNSFDAVSLTVVGDVLYVFGAEIGIAIDKSGKTLWSVHADVMLDEPFWDDGVSLLTTGERAIRAYRRGPMPPLPVTQEQRVHLAVRMVKERDKLDGAEWIRLGQLGDDAFVPVFETFLKADKSEATRDANVYRLWAALLAVTTPARTAQIIKTYEGLVLDDENGSALLTLLGEKGDQNLVIPMLLKALDEQQDNLEEAADRAGNAFYYIAQSDHPLAVEYMLSVLEDEEVDGLARRLAYLNLAHTGGKEGIASVLAHRKSDKLLPSLLERLQLDQATSGDKWDDPHMLETKRDAAGREWGLFTSGIMGNHFDLWVAERVDGKWGNPVFSGVPGSNRFKFHGQGEADPKLNGKSAEQLEKGAWFTEIVGNVSLTLDTDSDGLTNVMEKRLATDPQNADSDGDGKPDGTDAWPLVASRVLSEDEQVMAAVFQAVFQFEERKCPILVMTYSATKPFEMAGFGGQAFWIDASKNQGYSSPLTEHTSNGTSAAVFNYDEDRESATVVRWDKDHKEATVVLADITTHVSGQLFKVRVRKFGNDWLPVGADIR